jgi:glycosyltransferase involved in cell wall biosynthesis
MPSRAENSPCTVAECLQLGVPFLATGSGGTIELVAPEDRDLCLVGATAEELAAKLDLALKHGHRAARLAVTQADARAQWLRLTASKSSEDQSQDEPALHCKTTGGSNDGTATLPLVSICLMHPVPSPGFAELIDSCIGQNYLRLEIVLVEDGVAQQSPTIASLEAERERISVQVLSDVPRDQGAARNAAGTHANGTYLLFVDEGRVVLTPECVEAMVTAAIRTGCDIVSTVPLEFQHLSSWVDSRAGQIKNIPIGACAELGGFENCFGDGVLLVKRSSFERIGGYETPTGREIGDWLFLAKAVLSGLHLEVVPEALFRRGAASHAGLIRSTDVDNRRRILAMYNQKEARAFNRFIESVSTFNGSQNENLEAALNKLHGEARAVAFRISNSLEPNSEDAMRGLVQFCIEQNRISEALDFALCNGWALLSNSIGLAQQAAEAVALDTVRSNTLDLRFEVTLTDDIGQRVQSVSVFPARELARPTGVVASHAIEPGVRILKAAAALPPGTRSVSAIAEIKVSSQTPVSLAIVVSAANASLRLIKDKIESKEGFSWSGWLKLDGSATADLTVTLPGAASKLLDLHFLCKASEDGIYPEGVVTWKTVTANLSANGAVTSSAIEPSEAAKAIPRIVIERGILMTEKVDFPFPLFVPGEQTLVHPLPDRPVLVRIAGAVPQGTIGIRSVVSLELAQAHPVQFAIWAKSPPTTAKLESDFTAKDAFSGWFPVTDKFRRHSFTLNLEEPTTEPMDLYLATRVVGYPDVHFCHAVWHELLILT